MMDRQASVAVIIVNWNAEKYLEKCVLSVKNQTVKPKKIILVNNSRSDASWNASNGFLAGVDIIGDGDNIGFAAANNLAVKVASDCQWVALLNPDAFAERNWLENLLKAAEAQPQYSFFGGKLLNADNPEILDGLGDVYHVSGLAWRHGHGWKASKAPLDAVEIFSPCAAAAMYRRDAFESVGGFDEAYFCYFEDVDLGFRLRLAGHRCLLVPDATVKHIGSGISGKQSDFTIYHGHRNLVWTFVKNMPWPIMLIHLPQHILLNIVSVLTFAFRGKASVILKAKYDACRGVGRILSLRREIQKGRKAGVVFLWRWMEIKPFVFRCFSRGLGG